MTLWTSTTGSSNRGRLNRDRKAHHRVSWHGLIVRPPSTAASDESANIRAIASKPSRVISCPGERGGSKDCGQDYDSTTNVTHRTSECRLDSVIVESAVPRALVGVNH